MTIEEEPWVDNLRHNISTLCADRNAKVVSERLGFGHGYVKGILYGKHLPSLDALMRLCEYFDVRPDDLLLRRL